MGTASERLRELIDNLLCYARLRSGRASIAPEEVDLEAVAGEVVEELTAQAEQKGLALTLIAAASLPALRASREEMRVLLGNLVGNAVKYTDRGGITVSLAHHDGEHVLTVSDTGPGIPEDKRATVFEPFTQVTPVARHVSGFGLGLSIAKEIVRALGGSIELRSTIGEGTTFIVRVRGRLEAHE